jgi:hypothetical protein
MKSREGGALRHFGIAFGLALLFYIAAFHWIESCRVAKAPWKVTFEQGVKDPPVIMIHQPAKGVDSLRIVFEDAPPREQDQQTTMVFDTARPVPFEVPLGKCVFLDTTFFPGTVTLQCFGHEIEMIPRVLIVDHKEFPWNSGEIRVQARPETLKSADQ